MTDSLRARADERIRRHFGPRAETLIEALNPAWSAFDGARQASPLRRFQAATPKDGWTLRVEGDTPTLLHQELKSLPTDALHALEELRPWRKGPLAFLDTHIDAEWRSEKKWQRIAPLLGALDDKVVLDVGSNNGYYAHRLQELGAACVFGLEPTPLYVGQALCMEALAPQIASTTLPTGLDLMGHMRRDADVILLMGILYHHSDPLHVLRLCAQALRAGGTLLVETIVIPGDASSALFLPGKYTGASGFYWLPTMSCLESWLRRAGLKVIDALPPTATTPDEQRVTTWRGGDASLAEGLDPSDPSLTIEGHPAPLRTALRCTLA